MVLIQFYVLFIQQVLKFNSSGETWVEKTPYHPSEVTKLDTLVEQAEAEQPVVQEEETATEEPVPAIVAEEEEQEVPRVERKVIIVTVHFVAMATNCINTHS